MSPYDHKKIEKKWRAKWEEDAVGKASDDLAKKKTYLLVEFPFPSGEGLHVGHVRSYTALDILARKRRMQGENVLYPIGWDAFGLPTENYALKTGKDPRIVTKENTDTFRRQLKSLGISFDWSREVNTTDPAYYKWTQWIFIQMFKKGLAYKATTTINWCPKCKIGLANEEVVNGACERCGHSPVEKKEKDQWMLAITKYAQRLYDDLDTVDYIERAKTSQRNWIGPSEGAEIEFTLTNIPGQKDGKHKVTVFTTRPDTLFGATYLAISAELVKKWLDDGWKASIEVRTFVEETLLDEKTRVADHSEPEEKKGIATGVMAINPANGEKIPVWVANYVLPGYGTGALMAVPAHDERDWDFAKKYNLSIQHVIDPIEAFAHQTSDVSLADAEKKTKEHIALIREGKALYGGPGVLVNSGKFDGLSSEDAKKAITEAVGGKMLTRFKLRDWVFSRQRYWGEPIPMVFCEKDKWVPVPEDQLPLELPHVEKYQPTDTGESPLAKVEEWVATTCPTCGGPARRETDVMPNWAGSSWYYLRYTDSTNDKAIADPDKLKYWTPVDWYNGGMEHTTLHLLYSRFWHKFLFDIGVVPTAEPYKKRTSHGIILAKDGDKMSKSKGNVVNPDDIALRFGADTLRIYEMFMGPFDQAIAWNENNMMGPRRFIERVWRLAEKLIPEGTLPADAERVFHETIKKVTEDIETLGLNTAIAQMMTLLNRLEKEVHISRDTYRTFLLLVAPFAPHVAEELWEVIGEKGSVLAAPWPAYDPTKLVVDTCTIAVQVNGKVRGTISVSRDADQEAVKKAAFADPSVVKWTDGREIKKVVYVPGKILNIVLLEKPTI